jgi:hypothetical protein
MTAKQYPHFLFVHILTASEQDGAGNWSDPIDNWVLHSICREETNGKGSVVNGFDGKSTVFSSTVFLPRTAEKISEGSEIMICESDEVNVYTSAPIGVCRVKGQVLNFSKGQLHSKLWI